MKPVRRLVAAAVATAAAATVATPAFAAAASGKLTHVWSDAFAAASFTAFASFSPTSVGESSLIDDPETGAIRVESPIVAAEVVHDDLTQALSISSVKSSGGVKLDNGIRLPGGKGASGQRVPATMTLTNLEVDFATKAVYADVVGDHGVGTKTRQHFWTFGDVDDGPAVVTGTGDHAMLTLTREIGDLRITEVGFALLAQSMNLSAGFGIPSFRHVTDYGTIRMEVSAPIPEPSTVALMGLGMLGLAGLGSLRRGR